MVLAISMFLLPIFWALLDVYLMKRIERWCHANLSPKWARFWTVQRPQFLYRRKR